MILLENMKLGWKGLSGPNTCLLQTFLNYVRKVFITLGQFEIISQGVPDWPEIANYLKDAMLG
jgi:hypothetical protein